MAKKEKFIDSTGAETTLESFSNASPSRKEMEEVFQQVSSHMNRIRETLNTQALILGALSKLLLERGIFTVEQMDAAMVSIHDQAQQIANAKTTPIQ